MRAAAWGALVAIGCATGTSSGGSGDDAPDCDAASGPGTYARTVTHDGVDRPFTVHVPAGATGREALPLILNLHPFTLGGSDVMHRIWERESGFEPLADETGGFVVLHPEGTGSPTAWNAGEACCGEARDKDVDDVGFLRAAVADAAEVACIDTTRVYATGMSNGGYLSHRLACEAPDFVAAIAPVVGHLSPELDCDASRGVPVLQITGSEDNLELRAASVAHWVAQNECAAEPTSTETTGSATCETWSGCKDDVEVVHCVMDGGGHCWFSDIDPQMSPGCFPTTDLISQRKAWSFLSRWSTP